MIIHPCAKINLGLNVVERRPDGYHNLETVFLPLPVYDTLEVRTLADTCSAATPYVLDVTGTNELCAPASNLVVKAYMLLAKEHSLPRVAINLHKSIPSQAGMGGGSSDAAFMLRLLNEQYELNISTERLQRYAASLGADCAFFITADARHPRPVYATGIGDELHPMNADWNALKDKWICLIKPDVAVSTKEAYAGITPSPTAKRCADILQQPIETWRTELTNDFEKSIFAQLPALADVKRMFYDKGAVYAAMSGSGSTVFGIFDEDPHIESPYWNTTIKL